MGTGQVEAKVGLGRRQRKEVGKRGGGQEGSEEMGQRKEGSPGEGLGFRSFLVFPSSFLFFFILKQILETL
jgi:hypothetical protein